MRVVFDICGTLYDSNTTFDFCIWRASKLTKLALLALRSKPISALNKISYLCYKKELIPTRSIAIKTLKNIPKNLLFKQADEFVNTFLVNKKRLPITALLKEFQPNDIVLVSATLDCLAISIARYFNIPNVISSTLQYDERQICQGKLERDLLGNKHRLFEHIDFIATDNLDDAKLCQKAARSLILTKPKNKAFWLAQNLKNSTIMEI